MCLKGEQRGGGWFGRGALYILVKNPIYLGKGSHKGKIYPKLWDWVQRMLDSNRRKEGKIPSKSSRSQPNEAGAVALVPAQEVEKLIIDQVRALGKIKP